MPLTLPLTLTRLCHLLAALVSVFFWEIPVKAQELPSGLVVKARRACVEVHIKGQLRGGGVFVKDASGRTFVLTAAHLFHRPADTCAVVTEDDHSHFASLSAYDLGHDLALLEVEPELQRYGALRIAGTIPGETKPLFNFSPALGRRNLVLPGTVAHAGVSYTDFSSSQDYLAHFFVSGINPAYSSGGPWINRDGEVVGVQHGRLKGDEGAPSSGLSMVSPPSAIRSLIESNAVAKTPGIGGYLWEVSTTDRTFLDKLPAGIEGLVANPVFIDRPLSRAGVKPDDVIISCDGKPVKRIHQFLSRIREKPVGSSFRLEVISPGNGSVRPLEITTDSIEANWR